MVADRIIPSTMLAGYTLPTMAQAGIFLVLLGVSVEPWLLLCSILTFIPGALIGASWQRRPQFASSKGGAPPDIDVGLVVGLSVVGAIPAVLIAAFVVKAMPVETMRWLVVAVILYAAAVLLREATRRETQPLESLAEGLLD